MVVLGADPGFRHFGLCLVKFYPRKKPEVLLHQTLADGKTVVENIPALLDKITWPTKPELAGIEQILWYGKRKGVLALAHLTGAIWGYLLAQGVPTEVFAPKYVKALSATKTPPKGWDEHQIDALSLAELAYQLVVNGNDPSLVVNQKKSTRR